MSSFFLHKITDRQRSEREHGGRICICASLYATIKIKFMIPALKVILKHKYKDYETALKELKLETLYKRRESLCLKFAKKSLKLNNFKKNVPYQ